MQKVEQIRIPVRLADPDGNVDAMINVIREMFSNEDPQISIEWMDEFGDVESYCHYEDLNMNDRLIVDQTIMEYDQNMVRKTRE